MSELICTFNLNVLDIAQDSQELDICKPIWKLIKSENGEWLTHSSYKGSL